MTAVQLKYFFFVLCFVFGRKRVFFFVFVFGRKINCFFGRFYFSAENVKSIFGRLYIIIQLIGKDASIDYTLSVKNFLRLELDYTNVGIYACCFLFYG